MLGKNKDLYLGLIVFLTIVAFVLGFILNNDKALLKQAKYTIAYTTDEGAQIACINGTYDKDDIISAIKDGEMTVQSIVFYVEAGAITPNEVYKAVGKATSKAVIKKVVIDGVSYRVYVPLANEQKRADIKTKLEANKTDNALLVTPDQIISKLKKTFTIQSYNNNDIEMTCIAYQVLVEDNLFRDIADEKKLMNYMEAEVVAATAPKQYESYKQEYEAENYTRFVLYAQKYIKDIATAERFATLGLSIPTACMIGVPTGVVLFGIYFALGGFKKSKEEEVVKFD